MTTTAAREDWELPTDEDELEELRGVGLDVEPASGTQQQRDALASYQLKGIAELDAEIARRTGAMELELEFVRQRYERIMTPLRIRREQKEAQVKLIAQVTDEAGGYAKKARSRAVAFGTYGCRQQPAKVEVQEADKLLSWAIDKAPDLVAVTVRLSLPSALKILFAPEIAAAKKEVPKSALNDYVKKTGEIPPGTIDVPAAAEYYAKPQREAAE